MAFAWARISTLTPADARSGVDIQVCMPEITWNIQRRCVESNSSDKCRFKPAPGSLNPGARFGDVAWPHGKLLHSSPVPARKNPSVSRRLFTPNMQCVEDLFEYDFKRGFGNAWGKSMEYFSGI
jgi:hypothetical protein